MDKKDKAPEETPETSDPVEPAAEIADPEECADGDGSDPQDEPVPAKPTRGDFLERMAEKNKINAELVKLNAAKDGELKELNDKWLRTAAEFENFRRRTRKEWELLKQQSKAEVILEILNVVDDFERAFAVVEEAESSGYVEGFRLIYSNLTQVLDKVGVKRLDALHASFDPNYHMAVGQIESDTLESGQVAEVVLQGYLLGDTVIRPANVIVAK